MRTAQEIAYDESLSLERRAHLLAGIVDDPPSESERSLAEGYAEMIELKRLARQLAEDRDDELGRVPGR